MRKLGKVLILASILIAASVLLFAQTSLDRKETVYCSGGMWSPPSNWNPFQYTGLASSGTVGLLYEPLFGYNPVTGEFPPLLATSGKWLDKLTYQVKVRQGVQWSDGVDFSADDVVFTFEIAKKYDAITWSTLYASGGLDSVVKLDAETVNFKFSNPRYENFTPQLYSIPMVPKHVFDGKSQDELASGAFSESIGTGPYKHLTALADRDVFVRNDGWWGAKAYGKLPAPKNIVLLMVNDNATALGMMLKGDIDIDNNYTPGVKALVENYGVVTYFKELPYHLSFNTTMLYINSKKPVLSDPAFRRAIAFAIDKAKICKVDYQDMVLPAHSSGFLPTSTLRSYIDEKALSAQYVKFDVAAAKKMLDAAGYKMKGKYRADKAGKDFSIQINCPVGWSDWEIGIRMVAADLQAVGINAVAKPVDFSVWQRARFENTFDMLLDNNTTISSSPLSYLGGIVTQDFEATNNTRGNWGQYANPKIKELLEKLDRTNPATEKAASVKVMTEIQKILLKDMPSIPLWYNGLWFVGGTSVWTGYSSEANKLGVTCMWGNTWQLGTIATLVNMKLK